MVVLDNSSIRDDVGATSSSLTEIDAVVFSGKRTVVSLLSFISFDFSVAISPVERGEV